MQSMSKGKGRRPKEAKDEPVRNLANCRAGARALRRSVRVGARIRVWIWALGCRPPGDLDCGPTGVAPNREAVGEKEYGAAGGRARSAGNSGT